MANPDDARLKLLYAVDDNTFATADTVVAGDAFDLIANVEIGGNIQQNVDQLDLFVGLRNLTRSTEVLTTAFSEPLTPDNNGTVNREVRVDLAPGWKAEEGDVLEAVATLKVTYGANADYSFGRSDPIVVVS